jgi:hypothetical protein
LHDPPKFTQIVFYWFENIYLSSGSSDAGKASMMDGADQTFMKPLRHSDRMPFVILSPKTDEKMSPKVSDGE